ncbi:hypothetical protein ZWY2020_024756 [Hordeum vulgare]|nr:hypothetical protein ZWY2020_024756 [Hordeum vulgare]
MVRGSSLLQTLSPRLTSPPPSPAGLLSGRHHPVRADRGLRPADRRLCFTFFVRSLVSPTLCSGLMPLLMGMILVLVYSLNVALLRCIDVLFLLISIAQGTTKGPSAPWRHTIEGSDDMPAHIKSSMFGYGLTIPITDGCLNMGT